MSEKTGPKIFLLRILVIEHNTAFAQVMPFLLSEEIRAEFADSCGAALNESAIVSEQLLIADSVADFDLR